MKNMLYKATGASLNLWSLIAPEKAAHKAYTLFASPPQPNIRKKEEDFLETGTLINSVVQGHQVVEYHWGPADGPLVLLSYGWGYNAGRWRHFVPSLVKAGFHVLAYDPPGHGKNDGERLLNIVINSAIQQGLIRKYGRPEVFIGHSFGGTCGVYTMEHLEPALRPERCVIMASFSLTSQVLAEYKRALGLWSGVYHQMVRDLEKRVGLALETFDMARMSNNLGGVPCLLIYDPQEKVTPFFNALRYHNYWPGSMLLHAAGAGHHLGAMHVTNEVLNFAIKGKTDTAVSVNQRPIEAGHDLNRYFAGMEFFS